MDFKMSDNEDAEMSDINIIPLVDVMLVLLIIFMVTAPLSIGGINVSVPSSKARSLSLDEERVVLSIDKSGRFFIEKMEVAPKDLESRLKAIYEFRKEKNIYIRADKHVNYGQVVYAMSAAKIAGVQKMSMLTKSVGRGEK